MTAKFKGWFSVHILFVAKSHSANLFLLDTTLELSGVRYLVSSAASFGSQIFFLSFFLFFFMHVLQILMFSMAAPLPIFNSDWKHNLSISITWVIYCGIHIFLPSPDFSPQPQIYISNCMLDVPKTLQSPKIIYPWTNQFLLYSLLWKRTIIYPVTQNNLKSILDSGSNIQLISKLC